MDNMRPVFADPKSDVIFKKIFGERSHKGLLIELLNALLELDQTHRILDLEYLSPEQLPQHPAARLSILDVKCTDATGTRYVVEMQVLEVEAFQKRVVYNACKAYSTQLGVGQDYPALNDVIAVSICDFVLWPDQPGRPTVPMLSRWRMTERHNGAPGLPEVQFVFLELPKYASGDAPRTTAEKWAYFFRLADTFGRVPAALSEAPYATALEVARVSNLTEDEGTEYERQQMAVQDVRGALSLAERRGLEAGAIQGMAHGLEQGRAEGARALRGAILDLAEVLGLELSPAQRAEVSAAPLDELERLRAALKAQRRWPG